MSGPTRYCPACYAPNDWDDDRCVSCDTKLETDESYDDRLIWALNHPDTGIAMFAAELLAQRDAQQAIDPLIKLVESPDPYRAAAAARALTAFEGDDRVREVLQALRKHPSALVRRAISGSALPTARRR